MRWLRHRKARVDRDAGLIFAWRGMNTGLGRKLAAVAVVTAGAVSFAVAVRVRVVPPVPVSQRQGAVMLANHGDASIFLLGRLDEASPFPVRLETRGLPVVEDQLGAALASAGRSAETYQPRLRELPASEASRNLPALAVGQPVFPSLPKAAGDRESAAGPVRLVASLAPDSGELAARVVTPAPQLSMPADTATAGRVRRYLIEVRGDGSVGTVTPVEVVAAADMPGVEAWLARLRFDVTGGVAGWHPVEVRWLPDHD